MDAVPGQHRYPGIFRRIRAVVVDTVIMSLAFLVLGRLLVFVDIQGAVKFAGIIAVLFALEPGLVAFAGGTIGHKLMGMRIERAADGTNLGLFRAVLRFSAKALFGLPSFIFILTTKRHQAFHDYAAGSVVVVADPYKFEGEMIHAERIVEEEGYIYPSGLRRASVIFLYLFVMGIIFEVFYLSALSGKCYISDHCSSGEGVIVILGSILSLGLMGLTIVLGWRGQLWGCRRTRAPS